MSVNRDLHNAKKNKNDEFHTQLSDIEKELRHYKDQFKDKIVYCNCDDPTVSNFFHYFSYSFKFLKLRKLISTCYKSQERDLFSNHDSEKSIGLEFVGGMDSIPNSNDVKQFALNGDGDFRSDECIELLKQADVIVTNPPFSLFREYVAQLMQYEKKFLILGNQNAIAYKEIFKQIKENKLWLGYDNGGTKWFRVPDNYDIKTDTRKKIADGVKYFSMGNVGWFTNLDTTKRHEEIILYKKYNSEEFPKYDNYDAINVSRYTNIPLDYDGVMGVPITFIDKYNPDQFEIIGIDRYVKDNPNYGHRFTINGKETYARVLIKNKRLYA